MYILAGHFATACAEAERLCYNCKQPGHLSNDCTEPKFIQPKTCYNCGEGKKKLIFKGLYRN